MRRFTIALSACSLFTLMGCEDGPKQTYEPAPAGAANTFNDGKTPPFIDPSKQTYDEGDGGDNGTTKNELCTGPQKRDAWAHGFSQPLYPPRFASGLDMAGDDTWGGLTVEKAEQGFARADSTDFPQYKGEPNMRMCQSANVGSGDNYWGDNGEVEFYYYVSTRAIYYMFMNLGYLGSMDFDSRPNSAWGQHHYSIALGTQMQRDGQPLTAAWDATTKSDPASWANELYDAAIYTFAGFIPPNAASTVVSPNLTGAGEAIYYPQSCYLTGGCVLNAFGDTPYWYTPGLGVGFVMGPLSQGPKSGSTPTDLQMIKTKNLGFSLAHATLQFKNGGPYGVAADVGADHKRCEFAMGVDYADFLTNCVQVTGDDTKNVSEVNKLLGGLTHGRERYFFDVQGIDVNFTESELAPDAIIADADLPTAGDYMTQLNMDQGMLGRIANDYPGNDPLVPDADYHGTGLVYLEYARLVQIELNKYIDPAKRHALGDPACLDKNVVLDPATKTYIYPEGCTGFEGFVAPYDTAKFGLPTVASTGEDLQYIGSNLVGSAKVAAINAGIKIGLKPGNPIAIFCNRLTNGAAAQCGGASGGAGKQGALWATSAARVVAALGKGNVNSLPPDVRDNRFFFKAYLKALAKYFLVAGTDKENADGVHGADLDPDDIYFDSQGSGQYESGEYIYRSEVGQNDKYGTHPQVPTDLNVTADVLNGIFNDYNFSRDLYRGEEIIYASMLDTTVPGAIEGGDVGDDILLSNIFGSPLLAARFGAAADPLYCATNVDTVKCPAMYAPIDHSPGATGKTAALDEAGNPLLSRYKGALTGATEFSLGLHSAPDPADPTKNIAVGSNITILEQKPFLESALVDVPLHSDPFDVSSPPADPNVPSIQRLVPWVAKQSGVGFSIPKNATQNTFITTYELALAGTTVDANLDYDYLVITDPATGLQTYDPTKIEIKAVESAQFLGNVFLCDAVDPLADDKHSGATDILVARMYEPVANILDWLSNHPGAKESCDIIIRYSPFNNYVDFITSRKYGVQLAVTQGGGSGRIVDATLYDPNTVQ